MSYTNQTQGFNISHSSMSGMSSLERILFSTLIGTPCCVFLFINSIMLFTLRSKLVFRETSRYILLYNLLFADTALLALSQLMYILAACRALLSYPVCCVLLMLNKLATVISPLTLVVMSLERCVAVCYPLRHAAIITTKNTALAIIVVWSFSLLNVFIRVLLLSNFQFKDLEILQMTDICSGVFLLDEPIIYHYDQVYTYFVFLFAAVTIFSSYIGVMIAARSASTDKASAQKARNTLLLHLAQLGLSIFSSTHAAIVQFLSTFLPRLTIVRFQSLFYVFIYILPRCLTSLIYGVRDQTIRPILLYHLCCRLTLNHPSKS